MMTLTVETKFIASHWIPGHQTCGTPHSHDWTLNVTVKRKDGMGIFDEGMICDFHIVKARIKALQIPKSLNDVAPVPTCELLIRDWIVPGLSKLMNDLKVELHEVTLWEKCDYSITWIRDGRQQELMG